MNQPFAVEPPNKKTKFELSVVEDEMTGTFVAAETETTVNTSSSSCSVAEPAQQQQQQQQQQFSNIKQFNLQCDEVFDETLLECPGTSCSLMMHYQPQIQQPETVQHPPNPEIVQRPEVIGVLGEITENSATIGPPSHNKMKREWRSYGWYTSTEEMDEVRRRERVSKRKSASTVNGTKVFYRCNNWRRTRCNFRMYAMIYAPDRMCLFASGEHDHTPKDPEYVTETVPTVEGFPGMPVPTIAQQEVLTQFIMNAADNAQYLYGGATEQGSLDISESQEKTVKIKVHKNPYQLEDEQRITEMLQVATEINHTFTFNERNSEFCFEPRDPELKGRSVVFVDAGPLIIVIERDNGVDKSNEMWLKSNWNQFLWAIRGKCTRKPSGVSMNLANS